MGNKGGKETIRTVCGITDYLRCGLSVEVTDGVITRARPADFPDPIDKGACEKGLAAYQLVYHPDRLRYPLKRMGERGGGKWQRVSWDEALDSIVAELRRIAAQYGSTSIAWTAPILSNLTGGGYSRLMSLTGGTWVDWWGCGDAAGPCADVATFGSPMGERYLRRIEDPKFTIVWGYNPAVTVYPFMRRITRDREKGCKVVVIDPRFTETASHADEHVPIRPGTDGALALGMIHVVLERGLQDERFIAENTVGPLLVRGDNGLFLRESDLVEGGSGQRFMVFDVVTDRAQPSDNPGVSAAITGVHSIAGIQCRPAYQLLANMVQEYTPEKVSQITDVPAGVIRRLAIDYATHKPASIYRGWGLQRSFYGDLSCRAINTLAALTGNINSKRPSTFVLNAHPFLMPAGPYTNIPLMSLYDAIIKGEPFPIKAVWCTWHNPINQMPNTHRVIGELLPGLELLVVCDLFMTETAKYADYVLPVASFFECTDLCRTDLHNPYLQLQQKVIEPLYESRSDFQIAAELGRRMGYGEYFSKTEEQYIDEILASDHPTMEGVSVERLKEGPVMAKPLDRPQQLGTPTGRIEFYAESLKQFGQELPIYLEPVESARSEKAKNYPLTLLSTHPSNRVHSTLANIPSLLGKGPEPTLQINPADAERRSIGDGDVVRVFNDRGQLKVRAELSSSIKPGIVNITEGWWHHQYIEGHLNQLTHDRINPVQQHILQANAAFYDVLVEVEKV
jgi:anaerobic selenocysteine-containing dehydrogenase